MYRRDAGKGLFTEPNGKELKPEQRAQTRASHSQDGLERRLKLERRFKSDALRRRGDEDDKRVPCPERHVILDKTPEVGGSPAAKSRAAIPGSRPDRSYLHKRHRKERSQTAVGRWGEHIKGLLRQACLLD